VLAARAARSLIVVVGTAGRFTRTMQKPRTRKRRDGLVEIRRAVRPPTGDRSLARNILRAAVLAGCGSLFFLVSLAGYLLVAVMGVAAVRLAWGVRAASRGRPAPAPAPGRGPSGQRLRLVRAADDAA
jgi:hypothetical protein